ncbi:hypothetical protein FB451DRAFT_436137 [Mycena latifolia]|nr:hypothetical protein FB451DRAFT_436137 [Mycena latifolia]
MQFAPQSPISPAAGHPNSFPDPRRLYGGIPGPPPPQPHPYYPPWNAMPVPGPPPGAFRPTVDGWYIPQNPPAPMPPGLANHHNGPDPPYSTYSPTLVSTPSTTGKPLPPMDTWVHDFWKGRFAPFPGTTSPPSLLKKTPSRVVKITAPQDPKTQSPTSRHPPHSSNIIFETNTKHAPVPVVTEETEMEKKPKKEEDKEEKEPPVLDKYVGSYFLAAFDYSNVFRRIYLFPSIFKTFKTNHTSSEYFPRYPRFLVWIIFNDFCHLQ